MLCHSACYEFAVFQCRLALACCRSRPRGPRATTSGGAMEAGLRLESSAGIFLRTCFDDTRPEPLAERSLRSTSERRVATHAMACVTQASGNTSVRIDVEGGHRHFI